jgi:hypothetical protein
MALTIETAGEERESSIFLKDAPYLWTNLRPFLAASGLTAGKKYRTYLFDPATLANSEMIVEVLGVETLNVNGTSMEAFTLKETFKGLVVHTWLDAEGKTLKEESPIGLVMVREDRGTATSVSSSSGIPPDRVFENQAERDGPERL